MTLKGTTFDSKTWNAYVNTVTSQAIPGAVEFARYADSKGVKVFYVSNRTADEETATRKNLEKFGFPMGGNVDTMLMTRKQPDWGSAKGTRRAFVARSYRILINVGDNFGDFCRRLPRRRRGRAPEGHGGQQGALGTRVDHDRESELRLVRVGAVPARLQAVRWREAHLEARRPRRLAWSMRETPTAMTNASPTALLLNVGHALDHLFLLIFATAVAAIAAEWGMIWQDLMPYTVGAFVLFGLGSLPAGRLGDLWGRRAMMIVFFLGMGSRGCWSSRPCHGV